MKTFYSIFKMLFLFIGFTGVSLTASEEGKILVAKSFQVSSKGTLTVETVLGSIEIIPGDQDALRIEIRRKPSPLSDKEAQRLFDELMIRFEQRGNDVFVFIEHEKQGDWFHRMRHWRLQLQIIAYVPREYNLDLVTAGGSISVSDLNGEVKARTSGGSLTFGNINGPITGRTSGGSISLESCMGAVDVRTSGGSIRIGRVEGTVEAHTSGGSLKIVKAAGKVNASTSGGSITVEEAAGSITASTSGGSITAKITAQPADDCRLTTSGGTISVYIAPELKFSLDAKTSGGKVTTEFPVLIQGEIDRTHLVADVNGGGPLLYLRTSGGNIHIRKANNL
ncbi:MAG: DUF4097 domain-containing protein [candidate division KSB1 bacterium]|nr:DUF4097 domain-containing protein [candidate division KSB1 bacterium]